MNKGMSEGDSIHLLDEENGETLPPVKSSDGLYHFLLENGRTVAFVAPTLGILRQATNMTRPLSPGVQDDLGVTINLAQFLLAQVDGVAISQADIALKGGLDGLFDFQEASGVLAAVGALVRPPKPRPVTI